MRPRIFSRFRIMVAILATYIATQGCGPRTAPPDAARVVKIGVILPMTGEVAKYGKTALAAIEMAVGEINAKAGTGGVRFQAVFEDDALNPTVGLSAAKKLIETDKVAAIVGPLGSSVALAVAPFVEQRRVVLLSPGASTPELTGAGDFIFRNALSDVFEGQDLAKFTVQELKVKTIAILYVNNAFGVGLEQVFKEEFERLGGKVIAVEAFAQGSRDMRTQLVKIMRAQPQSTYLIGYEEMIAVFKQAKELGLRTRWLATTFLNDQDLVGKMGGAADGCVFAAWDYSPDSQDPRVRAFADKIRQRTGGLNADVFAANSYDAIYLLYDAIQRKGTTSEAIRDGLYSIDDFEGVTSKTSFDRNGDVMKPVRIRTIVDGKIRPYGG